MNFTRQQITTLSRGFVTQSKQKVQALQPRWQGFTLAQKCYALATVIAALALLVKVPSGAFHPIVFGLVIVGMLHEGFPRFMSVWNSLPGKAVILFLYAVIANYALASASTMVNAVTGVSAQSLPYSHNFAIILMLPSWFIVTTILALVMLQLVMPIYVLLLVVLKPFGIKLLWHPPDYQFVLTTALVRYLWMIALMMKLAIVSEQTGIMGYLSDTVMNREFASAESGLVIADPVAEPIGEPVGEPVGKPVGESVDDAEDAELVINHDVAKVAHNLESYKLIQRQLLAMFIYANEADSFSRCAHPKGSRVIELNDYEILLIEVDQESEVGYRYEVIACQSAAFAPYPQDRI